MPAIGRQGVGLGDHLPSRDSHVKQKSKTLRNKPKGEDNHCLGAGKRQQRGLGMGKKVFMGQTENLEACVSVAALAPDGNAGWNCSAVTFKSGFGWVWMCLAVAPGNTKEP